MKRIIKLTESDLKNIISSILEETSDFNNGGMEDTETSMDEQGFMGTLKNMYKAAVPEIKVFKGGSALSGTKNTVQISRAGGKIIK